MHTHTHTYTHTHTHTHTHIHMHTHTRSHSHTHTRMPILILLNQNAACTVSVVQVENYPLDTSYHSNQLWFGDKKGNLNLMDTTMGKFEMVQVSVLLSIQFIIDRFYIVLFSTLEQTHCVRM